MAAPDIVGKDIDGHTFKLSDYRGKVVVLDFWGDW
ncbi:MAG: redoxin domain-containing protein [Planctomycetota bacterium]|nr:redoxin domain-containing protein [Planctomycetota bacterium]